MPPRLSNAVVVERLKAIHGDRYDYSGVQYTGRRNRITIGCPIHGEFEQIANMHLNGAGCLKCKHTESSLSYIARAAALFPEKLRAVSGERYRPDDIAYRGAKVPTEITCVKHGVFKLRPADLLNGHGCPACASMDSRYLYVFRLEGFPENIFKIGITTNLSRRKTELLRHWTGSDIVLVRAFDYGRTGNAQLVEHSLLGYLEGRGIPRDMMPSGYTECICTPYTEGRFLQILDKYIQTNDVRPHSCLTMGD